MNLRKHLAGVAVFLFIFSGTVIIFNSLLPMIMETPGMTVIPTQPASPIEVSYKVPYVSLDFINQQSYTMITVDGTVSRGIRGTLWVRTYFFAPDFDRKRVWASEAVEISVSSEVNDRLEILSTASCDWCGRGSTPVAGYFARVIVSTRSASDTYLSDSEINRELTTAIPVVVQAPRDSRP